MQIHTPGGDAFIVQDALTSNGFRFVFVPLDPSDGEPTLSSDVFATREDCERFIYFHYDY